MNDAWNGTGYQFGGGDWAINGVVIHFEAGWRQGFWNDADGDGLPDELDPCVNDPSNNSAWWGGGSWAIDGIWRTFPGQFHGTNVADSDGDGIPDDLDPLPNDSTNNSFWWNGGTYTIGGQTCHFDARYYQGSGLDSDGDGIPDGADPYATDSLNGSTRYWQGGDWVVNNGNGTTALHYEPGQYLESLNWGDSDNDGLPDGLDPFPDDCFNGNYFTLNGGSYMANNQPVYYGMGTYGGVWSDRDGDSIPDVVDVLPDDPYNGNDSDGDGIPDSVEARVHLLNGSVADSGDVRFVNGETDGLTWLQAYQNGIPLDQLLDPALDSDHDGMSDLYEILNGLARSSPNDAADAPVNHMFNASGQRDSTGAVMNDFILNVEKARAGLPLNTVIDDAQTYESLTGHPPGAGITQNGQLDVTENDWDGDGVSNVDEVLVFGTDPRDASSRASVEELLAAYQLNRTSLTTNASFATLFASGSEESGGSGSSGADVPDPDLGGLSLNSLGGLAAASLAQAGLPSTTTSAATGSGPPKPLPGTGSADVKFQVRWVEVELIEGEYQHAPQGAAGWIDHGEESTPRYEFQSQVWQSTTRGLASRWSTSVSAGQADVSAPQAAAHLNDLEKLPWRDATSGDDMHLTSFDATGEAVPVPEMSMTSPDGLQQAGTAYVQGHYRRVRKVEVRLMARNRLDAPVSRTFVLPCLIRDTAGNGANPQTEAAVARVQVGQDGATDIPAGTASSTGETDGQPNHGIIRPTSKEDPATAKAKDRDLSPIEVVVPDVPANDSIVELPVLASTEGSDDIYAAGTSGSSQPGGSQSGTDFTPSFKPATELKIAKLEPGPTGGTGSKGAIIESGSASLLAPGNDPDCFYVRIPGLSYMGDGSRVSIKIKTTDAPDKLVPGSPSHNDPATEVELKYAAAAKEYRTPAMMLVSNTSDDGYAHSDAVPDYNIGSDDHDLVDDRTHIAALGSKATITAVIIKKSAGADPVTVSTLHPDVPIKSLRSVDVQVFKFTDCGVPDSKIIQDMETARETFAQVGLTINFPNFIDGKIVSIEVPEELKGTGGTNVVAYPGAWKGPTIQAQQLLTPCGVDGAKNHFVVIYCLEVKAPANSAALGAWSYTKEGCKGALQWSGATIIGGLSVSSYLTLSHELGHLFTNGAHFGARFGMPYLEYGYQPINNGDPPIPPNTSQIKHNLMRQGVPDLSAGIQSACRLYQFQQNRIHAILK